MDELITNIIDEGKTSYHEYILYTISTSSTDDGRVEIDGEYYKPVSTVESLKYKVSDGVNAEPVINWTVLPNVGTGTITIPGQKNRIVSEVNSRYITIIAVHDNGQQITVELPYLLKPMIGIDTTTEPI